MPFRKVLKMATTEYNLSYIVSKTEQGQYHTDLKTQRHCRKEKGCCIDNSTLLHYIERQKGQKIPISQVLKMATTEYHLSHIVLKTGQGQYHTD